MAATSTNQISVTPNTILLDPKTGQLTYEGFLVFQAIIAFFQGTQSAAVTTDGIQTLTNKTLDGDANTFTDIPTASLKNRTGNGGKVVTATTVGTSGNLAQWDASGNVGDGPSPAGFVSASTLNSYVAKNFVTNGAVATVLGSLGPVGSNTTVQGWTVVYDVSGTLLGYTPYF